MSLDEPISKSQRKREMHDLQALGEALARLSVDKIKQLELPETLENALIEVKSFKSHGAVRRQMQFIGRLMRDVDPAPLQAYLDQLQGQSRESVAQQHLAEQWRIRLLENIQLLDEFCQQYPTCDRTQLRQLITSTLKERQAGKPPRQFRQLFRLILEHLNPHTANTDENISA